MRMRKTRLPYAIESFLEYPVQSCAIIIVSPLRRHVRKDRRRILQARVDAAQANLSASVPPSCSQCWGPKATKSDWLSKRPKTWWSIAKKSTSASFAN